MPDIVQWTALVGMVAVAVMFLMEVRRWRSVGAIIGRTQRSLRIWLVVLIEALFMMMIVGPMFVEGRDALSELIYWTVCMILGLSVVVLALLDLREVVKGYARANRRMFREQRTFRDPRGRDEDTK